MNFREMLLPPTTRELSATGLRLVEEARKAMQEDPWYERAGFHPDVDLKHVGFVFTRDDQHKRLAVPVYVANLDLRAVLHHPEDNSSTSWRVSPTQVFLDSD